VFNPVVQGRRFDPDGAYVARWVPELAAVPARFRHAPWEAHRPASAAAYPARPIVDLDAGRRDALAALARLRA
jgi:deoxyribodipyrimidine photo-lyase